ncbi:hypothetical protein FT641_27285 [Bacillus paranthracis]|uniref:hypothetical protein n=1 Tax=Bacillus paranthracis TaxID=2026186 RepID=UPI0018790BE1|nr:hypothetical protein [Bacillus paranthracis]MBE7117279.1 hypothetical protein [Bacillus paranthracis]MBE7134893.1 hypothetical protein [Bacillus paranthracis]MBE7156381.1 hypothetical protein [Bacillus paranthracis]
MGLFDFVSWCNLERFREFLTEDMWYWVDNYFSYETTIVIKHIFMIIPFVIATFILTCVLCAWLSFRVRWQESLEKVSLLRVPSKDGRKHYYMAEPSSSLEILESASTFLFWKILFKKKHIAFKDYKKARRIFRIILFITIITAIIGVLSVFAVMWYPTHAHPI